MVRIEFAGTVKSVKKWMQRSVDPFFMLVVTERSKGNQLSGAEFSVPCVKHTEGTSLSPGIWTERLVKEMKKKKHRYLLFMLLCRAEGPSSVRTPSTIRGGTTTSRTTAAAHLVKDTKGEYLLDREIGAGGSGS
jgi:hypothetical protein